MGRLETFSLAISAEEPIISSLIQGARTIMESILKFITMSIITTKNRAQLTILIILSN